MKLQADTRHVIYNMKIDALKSAEGILKRQLGDVYVDRESDEFKKIKGDIQKDLYGNTNASNELMQIADCNAVYKYMDVRSRFLRSKISDSLLKELGMPDSKTFLKPALSFHMECQLNTDLKATTDKILNNYANLQPGNTQIPGVMRPIIDEIFKKLRIVKVTSRIKSPLSVMNNLTGKNEKKWGPTYDMYGMRIFVNEASLFDAFTTCASIAYEQVEKPYVRNIAISFSVKNKTSWTDFKFVVQFSAAGNPVAEIQIVPIESFITDESVKGHDTLKDELQGNQM